MFDLAAFLGRWHPVVVHVPIGALIVAAVLELLARTARWRGVRPAIAPIVVSGAIAACVAAVTGWLLGGSGYAGATFEWHERMGIAVAGTSLAAAIAYVASGRRAGAAETLTSQRGGDAIAGALLAVCAVMIAIAGHLGGTLTHGEGYLTERLPVWLGGFPPREVAARVPGDVHVYAELVQPVLTAKCATCHGAEAAAGGLRLDTAEGVKKGGRSGAVVVPGRADASEIVRRVWLPASDKDAMPPRGRRALTVAEASLLRWWIDHGAAVDSTLTDAELDPALRPAVESMVGRLLPGAPAILSVKVPPADPAALERVRALGVSVAPLASGTPLLDVHCTNVSRSFGDAELAHLAALAPQVTRLSLSGTQVTDAGVTRLASFVNLTRLHLDRTRVTDAGLAAIAGLSRLEYLNLYGTPVTDAGLARLTGLRALRDIYLWRTAVTPAGAERLRAALPRVRIDLGAPAGTQADYDAHGAP